MATPSEAIEVIQDVQGKHPGFRVLHAKGFFCTGTFTPTPQAAELTRAAHMQGPPVPVLVRYSNGAGYPRIRDGRPMVRGMAVNFTLPDGSQTDLSAQTARLFNSSTVDGFLEFVQAAKPGVSALWQLPRYVVRHPELLRTLRANALALRPPTSYATCSYHALHAFCWLATDGSSRFLRYHWRPEAGESHLSPLAVRGKDRNYLTDELATRLAGGPVRYHLDLQIADTGDSTVDPSAPWRSKEIVEAGVLEISELADDPEADGGVVVFDPTNVTDGIELSDDEILHFRSKAYSVSVEQRLGS